MNTQPVSKKEKPYPGDGSTPENTQLLADEYRKAAQSLLPTLKKQTPLTSAPFRLVAIQAIELYLNAYLLKNDCSPAEVRGLQHDFSQKAHLAKEKALLLRKKTHEHIVSLNETREYLTSRYAPDMSVKVSEINRLSATLEELSKKLSETQKNK